MASKFHELNVRLITDPRDYENKENLQVQLEIPPPSFKAMIDHVVSARPNKIIYHKTAFHYESIYGTDWCIELKN